jgi:hypothetical protein
VEHDPEDPPMVVGSTYAKCIHSNWQVLSMQSKISLSSILQRVHQICLGHIVQGETKTTVHGGYLILPLRTTALLW